MGRRPMPGSDTHRRHHLLNPLAKPSDIVKSAGCTSTAAGGKVGKSCPSAIQARGQVRLAILSESLAASGKFQ